MKRDPDNYNATATLPFKLKAKRGKNIQVVGLSDMVEGKPEIITVERIIGKKNLFVLRAFVPKEKKNEVKKDERTTA